MLVSQFFIPRIYSAVEDIKMRNSWAESIVSTFPLEQGSGLGLIQLHGIPGHDWSRAGCWVTILPERVSPFAWLHLPHAVSLLPSSSCFLQWENWQQLFLAGAYSYQYTSSLPPPHPLNPETLKAMWGVICTLSLTAVTGKDREQCVGCVWGWGYQIIVQKKEKKQEK